ncbi:hypothetical protein TNCV_771071 [Trichonephila clavipes]|nr:hypothetical protein TNCV_771071 [Trichonephila clavipes]
MFTVHCSIRDGNNCGFQSSVNEAIDALQTFPSAANDVKCYERMMHNRSSLLCYGLCVCEIHHCHTHDSLVISGNGAMMRVLSAPSVLCFLLHPAMVFLVSSNTLNYFCEG